MKNNNKNPITPSDWITYLQGHISNTIGIILPFAAAYILITITITQISLQSGEGGMPKTVPDISIFLMSMLFIVLFFVILAIRPYSKLSKRIIKGELKKHEEILKEYNTKIEKKDFLKSAWNEVKDYIRTYRMKNKSNKKSKKVMKNTQSKNAKQELGNWENDPAFVKYNK